MLFEPGEARPEVGPAPSLDRGLAWQVGGIDLADDAALRLELGSDLPYSAQNLASVPAGSEPEVSTMMAIVPIRCFEAMFRGIRSLRNASGAASTFGSPENRHRLLVAYPSFFGGYTDKAPTYAAAIAELKAEGKCPTETRHRQVKYLSNVIEADYGKLKLLIRPVRGFKRLKTVYATIKGFEVMRALRKGQAGIFAIQGGIVDEARIVERAFDLGPCALTEAVALLQDRLANAES